MLNLTAEFQGSGKLRLFGKTIIRTVFVVAFIVKIGKLL